MKQGKSSLFENKEAKKLRPLECAVTAGLQGMKFFGSFFQKRTPFFLGLHP
jgi:hypothetical protein